MGEYTTRPITKTELIKIVQTINNGFTTKDGAQVKPNNRIATILVTQANVGMRINDILQLTMDSIKVIGDSMFLDAVEEKTNKRRRFGISTELYYKLKEYANHNNIDDDRLLFPITQRVVQKVLKKCCDTLGYKEVSTHSFRKYYALLWYEKTNHNIKYVMDLLQHSNVTRTQLYLNIQPSNYNELLKETVSAIDLI